MSTKNMLKYHLGIPVLLFVVLLVIGASAVTAFFVAGMAGCASMMMFMMGGRSSGHDETQDGRESDRHVGH